LCSASPDGSLRLWKVATGKEIWRKEGHEGACYPMTLSPDGKSEEKGTFIFILSKKVD
jgi:WD40 repeat protein